MSQKYDGRRAAKRQTDDDRESNSQPTPHVTRGNCPILSVFLCLSRVDASIRLFGVGSHVCGLACINNVCTYTRGVYPRIIITSIPQQYSISGQGSSELYIRHIGTMEQPWNCPHGRPTMRHLSDVGIVEKREWGPVDWAAFIPR